MRLIKWLLNPESRTKRIAVLAIFSVGILSLLVGVASWLEDPRNRLLQQWFGGNTAERESLVTVQRDRCEGAPFILPADGFIGLLYGDPRGPYSEANPHQGIDIFSTTEAGITPVYAAYDGYLRRELDWRSTVILRVPNDPLDPTRQLWLYYTHMADRDGNDFINERFAPGVSEVFVPQGSLLGYTGNYNGNSPRGIGVHLHFSIVQDDGNGRYLNELQYENTLDPAPYLGLPVNYACSSGQDSAMQCSTEPGCL